MNPLPPSLLGLSLALPPNVQAIDHILQHINNLLMPKTIDAAVFNDLQRVVQVYGSCRPWTVGAMDGAAARGRLDILQRLHETRTEGCSSAAFIGAAASGDHLEVLQWLYEVIPELRNPDDEAVAAAGHGHLRVVTWLATRFLSFFGARSTLEAAAANGHVNVVSYLLGQWNFVLTDDSFVLAARNGHLEVVKLFYSLESFSPWSFLVDRALAEAMKSGHDQMVEFLTSKSSTLSTAAERGQLDMVRRLLDQCVHKPRELATALRQAASNNNYEIVELLLSKILPLDSKFISLETHKCYKAIFCELFFSVVQTGYTRIVKMLLDMGGHQFGNVGTVGRALMVATENNQVKVAKLLLNVGEASFSADFQRHIKSAAEIVVERHVESELVLGRHHVELAELLVGKCDDIDVDLALDIAVQKSDFEMAKCRGNQQVQLLIRTAANGQVEMTKILLENCSQHTIEEAVMQAELSDKIEVLGILLEKCDSATLKRIFVRAAMDNRAGVVNFLLEKVVELQVSSELMLSAACGRVKMLEVLLERSSLSNLGDANSIAVVAGQCHAAKLLHERYDVANASIDGSSDDNTKVESMPVRKRARLQEVEETGDSEVS